MPLSLALVRYTDPADKNERDGMAVEDGGASLSLLSLSNSDRLTD